MPSKEDRVTLPKILHINDANVRNVNPIVSCLIAGKECIFFLTIAFNNNAPNNMEIKSINNSQNRGVKDGEISKLSAQ